MISRRRKINIRFKYKIHLESYDNLGFKLEALYKYWQREKGTQVEYNSITESEETEMKLGETKADGIWRVKYQRKGNYTEKESQTSA